MSFNDLGLSEDVVRAVDDAGYTEPTPIQAQAIPVVLMNRDILGCAQTGTGKTASFTLPMIDILSHGRAKARMPRSLILEPTRELAAQVAENFDKYGKYHKLSKVLLIGGTSMSQQIKVIDRGPDVIIATPGRLLDLFDRGRLLLTDVKTLVIDEADRMLDMGFIPDVERIVSLLSPIRQTLFFSATMPPEIRRLADVFLMNPKEITVAPPSSVADTVEQSLIMVPHGDGKRPGGGAKEKRAALRTLIQAQDNIQNALLFCNRKREVSVLARSLAKHGHSVCQLHGDMSQPARMETLTKFKNNEYKMMVCSDVAARGLDIQTVSHVFNFDIPTHAEDYVHRIGRTGRAGRKGHAFTLAVPEEKKYIDAIEKLTGKPIPNVKANALSASARIADAESAPAAKEPAPEADAAPEQQKEESRSRGRGRGRDRSGERKETPKETKPERRDSSRRDTEERRAEEERRVTENMTPEEHRESQRRENKRRESEDRRDAKDSSTGDDNTPAASDTQDTPDTTDTTDTKDARDSKAPEKKRDNNQNRDGNRKPEGNRSRSRGRGRGRDHEEVSALPNTTVKGMGDNLPAFMQRPFEMPGAKPESKSAAKPKAAKKPAKKKPAAKKKVEAKAEAGEA